MNAADNLNNHHAANDFGIAPSHFSRRLIKEMKILTENVDVQKYFRFESLKQDSGKLCIYGYLLPQEEPYKNGAFKVRITLSTYFPCGPPELQLLTHLYHPAVNEDISKPEFCCTCCSVPFHIPTSYICDFIKYYIHIIDHPDSSCAGCTNNYEARRLYHEDKTRYIQRASERVTQYAYPREINP